MIFAEADQLLSLVGMIYNAATDPSLWSGALEQVDRDEMARGRAAALASIADSERSDGCSLSMPTAHSAEIGSPVRLQLAPSKIAIRNARNGA